MKPIFAHKEKLFAGITFPQRIWSFDSEDLICITHSVFRMGRIWRSDEKIFLFHKNDLFNARYTLRSRYTIEHVLHLADQKAVLVSTGHYNGDEAYEGMLLLWNYHDGEITVLQEGRHFLSSAYVDGGRIKTTVMPQDDLDAEEGFAEIQTYLLPHPLQAFQHVEDLAFLSSKLIKLDVAEIYRLREETLDHMRQLAGNLTWRPSGPIGPVVVSGSIVVAAVQNFGLKLFDTQLNLYNEFYLGLGYPTALLKFEDKVLLTYEVGLTQKPGCRPRSRIYLWSFKTGKIELITEWYQSYKVLINHKYLMLNSRDFNKGGLKCNTLVINLQNGEIVEGETDNRLRFFKNLERSSHAYAIEFIEKNAMNVVTGEPDWTKTTLLEFGQKYVVNLSNPGFVIDHLLVFNGKTREALPKMPAYFITIYNTNSKELKRLNSGKEEYLEMDVIKRENEYFVCGLTKDNEVDIQSIQTGRFAALIDLGDFGISDAISFVIEGEDLIVGTLFGDVFLIPQILKLQA